MEGLIELRDIKRVRPVTIVFILLVIVATFLWSACIILYFMAPSSEPVAGVGSVEQPVGQTPLLTKLHSYDRQWSVSSSLEVQQALDIIAETEKIQQDAKAQATLENELNQSKLDSLIEQQQALQNRLDKEAEEKIAALGGVDATTDDEVYIEDATQVNDPVASIPGYIGKFHAQFVCTCASCFKPEEWPDFSAGDRCILADIAVIPAGITVTLDQGSAGEFTVIDANGLVSGNKIIVLNPNHSESNGSMQLYPNLFKKE